VHTIDDVVDEIIKKHNGLNRDTTEAISRLDAKVNKLQADLAAIHNHYRSELCGTCCHESVCSKKNSIKYGDECEEHSFPCWYEGELSEVEPEKVEPEKEETNADHI